MHCRLFTAVAPFVLAGCSLFGYEHHQLVSPIEAFDAPNGSQIRMQYRVTGRGNVHDPFAYGKWTYLKTDWIPISRIQGVSVVEGRVLSLCPAGLNKWYTPRRVRGEVGIDGDTVRLRLEVPKIKGEGWEPYEFNGTWPLERHAGAAIMPTDTGNSWTCEAGSL